MAVKPAEHIDYTNRCSRAIVALVHATGCTYHEAAVAVRTLVEQSDLDSIGRDARLDAAAYLVRTTALGQSR